MMGPVFFRSSRVEDVAAHCAIVAEAAGELPFYYYHIPSYNGAYVSVCRLLEAAKDRIANLAGAKFTHEDLADYGACLALEGGRFDILFGRDEMLLAALALGAKGAIGSTYNFAGLLYGGLLEAFDGGDLVRARRLQAKAVEIIDAISATACGYLPAAKAIVKMLGLDLGPVRSPLRDITVEEEKCCGRGLNALVSSSMRASCSGLPVCGRFCCAWNTARRVVLGRKGTSESSDRPMEQVYRGHAFDGGTFCVRVSQHATAAQRQPKPRITQRTSTRFHLRLATTLIFPSQ